MYRIVKNHGLRLGTILAYSMGEACYVRNKVMEW